MGVRRQVLGGLILAVLVSLCGTGTAGAGRVRVEGIRYWTAPDHTRVVIDLSGRADFHDWVLTGPDRIAIDIKNAVFSRSVGAREVNDGLIRRIRINRLRGRVAQVVLDLESASEYRAFALKKIKGKPDRIVIDVFKESSRREADRRRAIEKMKGRGVKIVAIDPGHGGEDPGAVGPRKIMEKDICLAIGKRLLNEINSHEGYKAFLTRQGDYFVSLRDRVRIAREHGADIFISLHLNASKDRRATGTEIYFVSLSGATDEAARQVAQRENAADLIGEIPSQADDNLIPILIDLRKTDTLSKSALLAESIHNEFSDGKLSAMRGVKQAEFAVLKALDIPSVLVEVGFITNGKERKKLSSRAYQKKVARSISRGILDYFRSYSVAGK